MAPHDKRPDDRQNPPNDEHPPSQFHAPPSQLPPETYNHLIHALLSLQPPPSHPHPPPTYPYPYPIHPTQGLPNYNYPWPPPVPPVPFPGQSSFYPPNIPPPLPPLAPSPVASTSTAYTAQDQETSEDGTSNSEDKRRRNTAASARFRAKKKIKTLSLEHTVADLTGRTEELEREATDLRRENTWLKEIVVLKGRNLAAVNLASQASGPSNQRGKDDHTEAESDSESAVKNKGKGKGKDKER